MHVKTPAESPVHENRSPAERLYNSQEARTLLGGISESKFRQLTRTGELRAVKQGAFVYVPQSAIDEYISRLPAAAGAA